MRLDGWPDTVREYLVCIFIVNITCYVRPHLDDGGSDGCHQRRPGSGHESISGVWGGGTASARAGEMPASVVSTTLVRHPASKISVVSTERRRSDPGERPARIQASLRLNIRLL